MRFALTDEQRLLRDSVRDSLAKLCTPAVVRGSWEVGYETIWPGLAEIGLLGLTASEARGGLGLDAFDLFALFEETGRCALPEPIVEHTAVAIPLLEQIAPGLADEWVPTAVAGEVQLAVGESDGLIPAAERADLFILHHNGSIHAVPRADVVLCPEQSVDRSRKLCRVEWTRTARTLLAEDEEAERAWALAADRAALGTSAQLLGLARWMIDTAVEYAKVREQFGRAIGSFQAVSHKLVDALVALELARPLVMRAAVSMAAGSPDARTHVSMAKARASEAATLAGRVSLQVHGAIGYAVEHDLHLWMKRAWALAAAWGDASHHRARVAEAILGDSIGIKE
jgi:alkylation response protein AidB-like acyl-CoA dehydrogenase